MARTAIVVDDSAMITRVMSDLLASIGINVLSTAFDGEAGSWRLEAPTPDGMVAPSTESWNRTEGWPLCHPERVLCGTQRTRRNRVAWLPE